MEVLFYKSIFWGSYLVFPVIFFGFYWLIKGNQALKVVAILLLGFSFLFVEMRFVEPQMLSVNEVGIEVFGDTEEEMRIALLSDMHLGVFKDEDYLEKVVERVNELEVDMILLAGDFVYYAELENLPKLFKPLEGLNGKVFGVLGNHDFGVFTAEEDFSEEMVGVMEDVGVEMIDNEVLRMHVKGEEYVLVGLGNVLAKDAKVDILSDLLPEERVMVLTHDPDVLAFYPEGVVDLTMAGHTHCGQMRIPLLYKRVIPTKGVFDKGLTKEEKSLLYITCGVGEMGLPMRFLNPPEIAVLTVN